MNRASKRLRLFWVQRVSRQIQFNKQYDIHPEHLLAKAARVMLRAAWDNAGRLSVRHCLRGRDCPGVYT